MTGSHLRRQSARYADCAKPGEMTDRFGNTLKKGDTLYSVRSTAAKMRVIAVDERVITLQPKHSTAGPVCLSQEDLDRSDWRKL